MPPIPTNRAYYNDSYATLHDLVSSCLHPLSASLELSCTVLLHGPRGVGKRTMIRWVVERCGVHLVEVNCYDFAGETDAKTEASLRGRFDRAMTCAPCVFLLRHVDALARKSVVLETGQGGFRFLLFGHGWCREFWEEK